MLIVIQAKPKNFFTINGHYYSKHSILGKMSMSLHDQVSWSNPFWEWIEGPKDQGEDT